MSSALNTRERVAATLGRRRRSERTFRGLGLGAILIAHFVLLRRTHQAADLYPGTDGSSPAVGLWSAAGMTAWVVGAAVFYLAAYPPSLLGIAAIGGTVPSFVIALVIYLAMTRPASAKSK